jgi:hypothetical protein
MILFFIEKEKACICAKVFQKIVGLKSVEEFIQIVQSLVYTENWVEQFAKTKNAKINSQTTNKVIKPCRERATFENRFRLI